MSQHVPSSPGGTVIPILTSSAGPQVLPLPFARPTTRHTQHNASVVDTLARPLRDLRISVTDRCNFRCGYCMPRSAFGRDHAFLPHAALLSFEEITRSAKLFLSLGVRKLRITGGEPLLRKDLERLIAQLAQLRTLDGTPPELTLTTNGTLLARKAHALKDAGLQRVTVSLDALDDAVFRRMSDAETSVHDVLAGIDQAMAVGLGPIKVNMVVQRGVNDAQILPMARHFRGSSIELRFIEFMDVGQTNRWQMDQVLPSDQVRALIAQQWPLQPASAQVPGATAEQWSYVDGQGRIGLISSVTKAFCSDCNRLRLSTDGRLYTCLFASQGHDLKTALRDPQMDDAQIQAQLATLWQQRSDRYSVQRTMAPETLTPPSQRKIEMSFIGG
jgi:cyclic pyranopterin phosphate synthase